MALASQALLTATVCPHTCSYSMKLTAARLVKHTKLLMQIIIHMNAKYHSDYKIVLILARWKGNTLYLPETTSVPSSSRYSFTLSGRGSITLGKKKKKKKENEFSNLLLLANKELNKNNSF